MNLAELTDDQLIVMIATAVGGALVFLVIVVWIYLRSTASKRRRKLANQPYSMERSMSIDDFNQPADPSPLPQVNLSRRQSAAAPQEPAGEPFDDGPVDLEARLGGEAPASPPPAELPRPVAPAPSTAAAAVRPADQELLRLLRDAHTGQLVVIVGGRRYARLSDVTDKKVGQLILEATAHLLRFTNGMLSTRDGLRSVAPPPVNPLSAAPVVEPEQPAAPPPAVQPPRPPVSSVRPPVQAEPLRPRGGLLSRFGPAAEATSAPVGLNLADEINEIVQRRLATSPLGNTVRVDVTAAPGGGIRILVNGQVYQTPDEIADPAVKDLVKSAIQEWERT